MDKFTDFDIDLDFGKMHEDNLRKILESTGSRIEVKTERDIWKSTGNMAMEIEYKGRSSGIKITKADWWAHIFCFEDEVQMIFLLPVKKVKSILNNIFMNDKAVFINGGDNNNSKIMLVKIKDFAAEV